MVRTRGISSPLWFQMLAPERKGLDCAATPGGYTRKSRQCTASPIGFIAKSRARTHGSGFSDRKVASVVAGRAGLRQRADRDAAIEWD